MRLLLILALGVLIVVLRHTYFHVIYFGGLGKVIKSMLMPLLGAFFAAEIFPGLPTSLIAVIDLILLIIVAVGRKNRSPE